jgi:hypothetical protein
MGRNKKILSVLLALVVILASVLAVYYLEYMSPCSNLPQGNPSLVYDFSNINSGGSLLGWNASGSVATNETGDAITIHLGGSLTRQFKAVSSKVGVSYNYTDYFGMTMLVSRQLNGQVGNLPLYVNAPSAHALQTPDIVTSVIYTTTFDVNNGTTFALEFKASNEYTLVFLCQVKLWNSAEFP